jgi:hypothetical protein
MIWSLARFRPHGFDSNEVLLQLVCHLYNCFHVRVEKLKVSAVLFKTENLSGYQERSEMPRKLYNLSLAK